MLDWFAERKKAMVAFVLPLAAWLNEMFGVELNTNLVLGIIALIGTGAVYKVQNKPLTRKE